MFVDVLNRLIKEKGVSRSQVFKDLGIGKNTSYNWVDGNLPNASTLNDIANYFGVTADFLLEKESTKKEPDVQKNAEPYNSVDDMLTKMAINLFANLPVSDKRLAVELIERLSGTRDKR